MRTYILLQLNAEFMVAFWPFSPIVGSSHLEGQMTKLETQQKSQQVRKPRRKSATQSKTPANSDLEFIRKILEPYGHKIWIRNNSYYIVIDGENQKFDTNGELYTFLKAKGFI